MKTYEECIDDLKKDHQITNIFDDVLQDFPNIAVYCEIMYPGSVMKFTVNGDEFNTIEVKCSSNITDIDELDNQHLLNLQKLTIGAQAIVGNKTIKLKESIMCSGNLPEQLFTYKSFDKDGHLIESQTSMTLSFIPNDNVEMPVYTAQNFENVKAIPSFLNQTMKLYSDKFYPELIETNSYKNLEGLLVISS